MSKCLGNIYITWLVWGRDERVGQEDHVFEPQGHPLPLVGLSPVSNVKYFWMK
jgi:hypothetical protein